MNILAKCVNPKCPVFDIEKSVHVGQFLEYGAPNDRVKCPSCGDLMQTTKSEATSMLRGSVRGTSGQTGDAFLSQGEFAGPYAGQMV